MTNDDWNLMHGEIISGYRLGELLQNDQRRALFRASNGDEAACLWLEIAGPEAETDLRRYLEAGFLSHPNLARTLGAGQAEIKQEIYLYLLTEPYHFALNDVRFPHPLDLADVRALVRDIVAGLNFLHSENMVYCALRADTVWRVGETWKLADYSQLRIIGAHEPQEIHHLMADPAWNGPPEAFEGTVSPGWDAWSLGVLLNTALNPLPDNLNSAVQELFETPADRRISLDEFAKRLEPVPIRHTVVGDDDLPGLAVVRPAPREQAALPPPRAKRKMWVAPAVTAAIAAVILVSFALRQPATSFAVSPAVNRPPAGAQPAPPQSAPSATPPPRSEPVSEKVGAMTPKTPEEKSIAEVLDRWLESQRQGNVTEQLRCYAPVVDRFFGRQRLTLDQLRREKLRELSLPRNRQSLEIDNVVFRRVTPEWAVVDFHKNWTFAARRFPAEAGEELVLRPVRGEWKISSERETRAN